MKSLYESILDDEDVLIDKAKDKYNFIYSSLKHNEVDNCVKHLNDIEFKPVEKKGVWKKASPIFIGANDIIFEAPNAHFSLIHIMVIREMMFIYFPKPRYKKNLIEDLRRNYNMSEKKYKEFKQDLIRELDLIPDKTFSGDCWKSKKYIG